jgi:hypothetical protein
MDAGGDPSLGKVTAGGKSPNLPFLIQRTARFFLTVSLRVSGKDMGVGGGFYQDWAIYGGIRAASPTSGSSWIRFSLAQILLGAAAFFKI